jgi:hypothetical protein
VSRRLSRLAGVVVLSTLAISGPTTVTAAGVATTAASKPETPSADELSRTLIARYERCFDGCRERSGSDYATCALSCAGSTLAELDRLDREQKNCMRPCMESLGKCVVGCEHKDRDGTDAATCRLQCKNEARVRLEDCSKRERD